MVNIHISSYFRHTYLHTYIHTRVHRFFSPKKFASDSVYLRRWQIGKSGRFFSASHQASGWPDLGEFSPFVRLFIPGLCLNYTSSRKFGHFFIDEVFYQNWQKICRLRYFLAVFKTSVTLSAIFLLEWIG
jgi:hypothetical protein